MSDQWFIRVAGKEYGPASIETLREWKEDGRVLAGNEARRENNDVWFKASDIPGLFPVPVPATPPPVQKPTRGFWQICGDTFRIYFRGFFRYLGLTLLVVVPSICTQAITLFLESAPNVTADVRLLLQGGFGLCMLVLTIMAWPIYIAGIQLLTNELSEKRSLGFFPLLNESVKYWPRVAMLCVFVYFSYFFWTAVPFGLIFSIALGGPSAFSFFIALCLAALQVWIVGRLFINFMFWQQAAMLDGCGVGDSLRRSKSLARGGRQFPWYQRPMWQGVIIFSLWTAFVIVLNLPQVLPQLREYWQVVTTAQDPQAIVAAMQKMTPHNHGFDPVAFGLAMVQSILRPLVGIAFVLLYFEARARVSDDS